MSRNAARQYTGKDVLEIAKLFLKLGLIAFGGPAAHIAMMEDEVVTKRKWLDRQHFLDLIGATNLIPGPNSTEMAIHTGYLKAGFPGLIIAGVCFIFPAVLITGVFAYLYVQYGTLPEVEPFLYGIKPAVIIIILNAVYRLGATAIREWKFISIAITIAIINFIGLNEIYSILIGGIFGTLFIYISEKKNQLNSLIPLGFLSVISSSYFFQSIEKSEVSLTKLFLIFLKIGAVLFGSGYVLVAYLNGELVQGLNWLSKQELLDAIAIGQFTPGPVLSTATFIGYQIDGIQGALIATLGIFLPSFIFVLIINPIVPKIRNSKLFSVFLDAVNVSALAIMFVVAVKLGVEILVDTTGGINWKAIVIAVITAAAFLKIKKINSAYVVLGGAVLGYLLQLF
ncbi:MAG TPA: chromate transporter [Ignavibacteriales bacterium]|nr:MAG: chromate transporter [Ignavibacteria bacterium GWA2_35_9]OGU36591.1 MAG: chromate transporter [Ignavibacteria bacterium GWB2_35_6b]OGU52587.1 MAG: chromate transporter [Ignavibacteria bacterium GWC2_36_12]HCY76120.1 chromate transporter [Ignavibacteriales bacterium]